MKSKAQLCSLLVYNGQSECCNELKFFFFQGYKEVLHSLNLSVIIRKYPTEKLFNFFVCCLSGQSILPLAQFEIISNLLSSEEMSLAWNSTGTKIPLRPSLHSSVFLVELLFFYIVLKTLICIIMICFSVSLSVPIPRSPYDDLLSPQLIRFISTH